MPAVSERPSEAPTIFLGCRLLAHPPDTRATLHSEWSAGAPAPGTQAVGGADAKHTDRGGQEREHRQAAASVPLRGRG